MNDVSCFLPTLLRNLRVAQKRQAQKNLKSVFNMTKLPTGTLKVHENWEYSPPNLNCMVVRKE